MAKMQNIFFLKYLNQKIHHIFWIELIIRKIKNSIRENIGKIPEVWMNTRDIRLMNVL